MDRTETQTEATPAVAGQLTTVPQSGTVLPAGFEQHYDCWNTIGVIGNGTCRELTRFIHCRNCPVYAAAAAQLLDRPITPEQRREWTEHYSRQKKLTTPARISAVIFRIGSEWLALPTPAFLEVAERRTIHTLPHRSPREVVLGLVNIRGELLICTSLSRHLGLENAKDPRPEIPRGGIEGRGDMRLQTLDLKHGDRLLVTQWDGQRQVHPADEVHGIQHVPREELHEPPATVTQARHSCTRHVFTWHSGHTGAHTVGLLDADVLFSSLNRKLVARAAIRLSRRGGNAGRETEGQP